MAARPGRAVSAAWGAVGAAVGVLGAVARSKIVAVRLGPEGTGLTAEALQFSTLALAPAGLAMGPALLRRLSIGSDRLQEARHAFALALLLGFAGSALIVGLGPWLLPAEAPLLSLVLAVTWQFAQTLNQLPTQELTASGRFGVLAALNAAAVLLVSGGAVLGVFAWGLEGQFAGAAAGAAGAALVGFGLAYGAPTRFPLSLRAPPRQFVLETVKTGATGLVAGLAGQGALIAIRETAHAFGGASLVGQFQASWTISTTYFTVMLGGMLSYAFPRFASAASAEELGAEVRATLRFCLATVPPLVLLAILFRGVGIHALYDQRFETASHLLGYQLAGDILKGASWVIAGPLLVRGELRGYLVTEFAFAIALSGFSVILLPSLGEMAFGVGYLLAYLCYGAVALVVLQRTSGVRGVWPYYGVAVAGAGLAVAVNAAAGRWPGLTWPLAVLFVALGAAGPLRGRIQSRLSRLAERLRGAPR